MKIIIKSKDFSVTPAVESYLRKKVDSLNKFFKWFDEELILVEAELGRLARQQKGDIFRAEINLRLGGQLFRAEAEQFDIYAAIDEVRGELAQELRKFKDEKDTIFIRGARSIKKKFSVSPLARFRDK